MGSFFDGDWSDPENQRLMGFFAGMAKGFGKAAMPSSLPVGLGSALGEGAAGGYEGMQSGQKSAQDYRGTQLDQSSKTVGLDQQMILENMLRQALGMPPINADGMSKSARSPLFGIPSINAKAAPVQTPTLAPGNSGIAPGMDEEGNPAAPAQAAPSTSGPPNQQALRGAIMQKLLLGAAPTDYQKATIYANGLPEGPEKVEAQRAAAKAAGIDITQESRAGSVQTMWDPTEGRYKIVFRNPHLPDGVTLNDKGEAEEVPGAFKLMGEAARVEQGAKVEAHGKERSIDNWFETGGLGLGTQSGDAKPGAPGQQAGNPPPTFSARIAQLESSGDPTATNDKSSATGQHQFLNGTWLDQARKFLPKEVLAGKSDEQILAMRTDPQASAMVTDGYARTNMDSLQKAGVKNIGAPELYLAHHFGAGGAQSILKAPPNTPMEQVLSPEVMKANPELQGATVADVYSHARQGMKGLAPIPTQGQPKSPPASMTGGVKSTIPPIGDAAPIQKGEVYLKARIPEWAKQEDEWADAMPSNTIAEQRALAIADALKATQSGHWAEEKADIAAKLKAIGLGGLASSQVFGDPAAVQTALKDNFAATLEQIRAFTSRPAAVEVTLASKNFANPNLQPEANLKIIAQTVGTMRWDRAMMSDWAEAKKLGWQDPQDYQRAWIAKNPIQPYIEKVTKEIGPLKGMKGAAEVNQKVQTQITTENIQHTAKLHGQTEEQVRAALKAKGYQVPD